MNDMTDTPDVSLKPLRSVLYMPCSNTRALDKAQSLLADAILFDLEDAVAPDAKAQARLNIIDYLRNKDFGYRQRIVRINHLNSDWGVEDLKALAHVDFDAVCLPKVECTEEINEALAFLGKDIPIWVMIETPKGVMHVNDIAAHKNVQALVMGTNDLAKELRVQQSASRQEFMYAFGQCIMAARANHCEVLDGVYNQLDNSSGFIEICQQGKMLGFDGKTLIHPKQLEAANDVFKPSDTEIEEAKVIIEAWEKVDNDGVLVVNGRLVEELHVLAAKRLIVMSDAISAQSIE